MKKKQNAKKYGSDVISINIKCILHVFILRRERSKLLNIELLVVTGAY